MTSREDFKWSDEFKKLNKFTPDTSKIDMQLWFNKKSEIETELRILKDHNISIIKDLQDQREQLKLKDETIDMWKRRFESVFSENEKLKQKLGIFPDNSKF